MYFVYPSYYKRFKCSAEKCRHNCCRGWEICIDESTAEKYLSEKGELGQKLSSSMTKDEDGYSFILRENGSCPFLMQNGLCELICKKGENYICDICSEHPRFVNSFDNRVEIGLGFSCETAANLIITNSEKVAFVSDSAELPENNPFFNEILETEYKLIDIVQNRSIPFTERIESLFAQCGINNFNFNAFYWKKILLDLEQLSEERKYCIDLLSNSEYIYLMNDYSVPFEQIIVYFFFRTIPQAVTDGKLIERIKFSILSLFIISTVFFNGEDFSIDKLVNICRIYSSEIEYSESNMNTLLSLLN